MDNRIVVAKFNNGERFAFTDFLFQYDYGQELKIEGLELPSVFEVHFASELHGESTTSLYTGGSVTIPDSYLTKSGKVYAWIYLHDTDSDGETEYSIVIDVKARAVPTHETPTPVQQDEIEQVLAALETAVVESETNVTHYPKIVEDYWYVWDAEAEDWENTGVHAQGPEGPQGPQGETGASGAQGPKGDKGDTGATGANGKDGADGKDGVDGQDGADGFSPIANVSKSGDTATITITDKNGTTTATVTDGTDGTTPDFSIGTVETLPAGSVATASITGTTAEPRLNLGIPQGNPGEVTTAQMNAAIEAAIISILPKKTVSGAVASFSDAEAGYPLVNLETEIVPIQSGTGDPSPSNIRSISGFSTGVLTDCGVNLWDEQWEVGSIDTSGNDAPSNTRFRSVGYIKIDATKTYYLVSTQTLGFRWYDSNKAFLSTSVSTLNGTFTPPSGAAYLRFVCTTSASYNNDISINYPSTDTSYHSYTVTTATVQFGQTVYGGTWKAKDGKVVDVPIKVKFSDIPQANWRYSNNRGNWNSYLFFADFPMRARATTGLSNVYAYQPNTSEANVSNNSYVLPSWNTYVYIRDDAITSTADFLQAHGDDYIIMKPATPTEITVDAVNLTARDGVNNIISNTGDTSLTYGAKITS